MSELRDRGTISRNGLKEIVSTLTDQQLDELFVSSTTGKRVGVLGKQHVISSLNTLTDEQKAAINDFRFPPKVEVSNSNDIDTTNTNIDLSHYHGGQLIVRRRKIRDRIQKLKEELISLEAQEKAYSEAIDKK